MLNFMDEREGPRKEVVQSIIRLPFQHGCSHRRRRLEKGLAYDDERGAIDGRHVLGGALHGRESPAGANGVAERGAGVYQGVAGGLDGRVGEVRCFVFSELDGHLGLDEVGFDGLVVVLEDLGPPPGKCIFYSLVS